jgi:hypothetical protein
MIGHHDEAQHMLSFPHNGRNYVGWTRPHAESAGIPAEVLDAAELAAARKRMQSTRRQMRLELAARAAVGAGPTLLDDVSAWVATQPIATQIEWADSSRYQRTHGAVADGGAALGMDDAALDELFAAAAAR